MLKVSVAHSLELDTSDAVEEVLHQCHEQFGVLKPDAGLLFTGIDHDHQLILKRINEVYSGIELIGCTTFGELSSVHGVTDDSIVLLLFFSDEITFKAGVAESISKDATNSIKKALKSAKSNLNDDPAMCLILPNTSAGTGEVTAFVDLEDLIQGIHQGLGDSFPVFGGCAGDPNWFGGCQYYKDSVLTDAAPFFMISGSLLFSLGISAGWMPIGKKTKITHAQKNTIFKIGDLSALDFYKHYLGEFDFLGVVEYPLAVFENEGDNFYLRAPTFFDSEKGSMSFMATIPEGSTVQLTHATRDKTINGVEMSVNSALSKYPGSNPSLALCFTCMARKMVLGTRVQEEYHLLKKHFPNLPIAGFYTGGEIGPLDSGKPTRYHNETFLTLLMGIE